MTLPNYTFKCDECEDVVKKFLRLSSDPRELLDCGCGAKMRRIIVVSQIPSAVGKVWAGDWFKKTYGHDIAEGTERKSKEKVSFEKEKTALEKDGVKFNFKSKQVGGKERIVIPDKED